MEETSKVLHLDVHEGSEMRMLQVPISLISGTLGVQTRQYLAQDTQEKSVV
jgi:hypothetical protein